MKHTWCCLLWSRNPSPRGNQDGTRSRATTATIVQLVASCQSSFAKDCPSVGIYTFRSTVPVFDLSKFATVTQKTLGLALITISAVETSSRHQTSYSEMSILIADLQENDVVCGRSTVTHTHAGNKLFRSLIREHGFIYQGTPTRSVKKRATLNVIDAIRELGGRFLKVADHKSSKNTPDTFEVADFDFMYEKCSHALRSYRPTRKLKRAAVHSGKTTPGPQSSTAARRRPKTSQRKQVAVPQPAVIGNDSIPASLADTFASSTFQALYAMQQRIFESLRQAEEPTSSPSTSETSGVVSLDDDDEEDENNNEKYDDGNSLSSHLTDDAEMDEGNNIHELEHQQQQQQQQEQKSMLLEPSDQQSAEPVHDAGTLSRPPPLKRSPALGPHTLTPRPAASTTTTTNNHTDNTATLPATIAIDTTTTGMIVDDNDEDDKASVFSMSDYIDLPSFDLIDHDDDDCQPVAMNNVVVPDEKDVTTMEEV
jgi:hypothetical protein